MSALSSSWPPRNKYVADDDVESVEFWQLRKFNPRGSQLKTASVLGVDRSKRKSGELLGLRERQLDEISRALVETELAKERRVRCQALV